MSYPKRLPRRSDDRTGRGRYWLIALVWIAAPLGGAAVIFLAINSGGFRGAGLTIMYALLPLPILWLAYWWLDRYGPQPLRYKFAAFLWGGVVATTVSLALQLGISKFTDISERSLGIWIAPVTEEPAKCLFLVLIFCRARKVIDGVLDALFYAGLVAIGFALLENVGYYSLSYLGLPGTDMHGASGVASLFVVRGVFSPLAHPLFTSIFAIALGLAITQRFMIVRVFVLLLGVAGSMTLHHLWNASLSRPTLRMFVVVYLSLGVLLLALVIFAAMVRGRQVRALEKSLSYMALRGWIDPAEVAWLTHFRQRKKAIKFARAHGGRKAAKALEQYQKIATDAAVLHHYLMQGRRKTNGVARTHQMLDRMHSIRSLFVLPPPLPASGTFVY